jgi:histidine triad (HIT) family protein
MKRIPYLKREADKYIGERKVEPCFICELVEGDPRRDWHCILFEDDNFLVWLNPFPTQYGATLVSPKKHIEHIARDLNKEEYIKLQELVYIITKAVGKAVNPERMYVASFGSQQMNKHVHFHIIPIPSAVSIREQQMASMMPEIVGMLELEKDEWDELEQRIKRELKF